MGVPLSSTASKPLINTLEQWVRLEEFAVINPVGNNIVQVGGNLFKINNNVTSAHFCEF